MNDNDIEFYENERPVHSAFNKEKFCKKNKLDNGKYGSHVYKDGNCVFCSKIDPKFKRRNDYGRAE